MRIHDAIIGVVLLALSVAVIWHTRGFPAFPGQKYGPDLFPVLLSCGLGLCGALLVLRSRKAPAEAIVLAPWTGSPRHLASFALVLGSLVFYILSAETLGFLLTAFLVLSVMCAWLGLRPLSAIAVAVATTFAIDYSFGTLLRVPLPRGLLNLVT